MPKDNQEEEERAVAQCPEQIIPLGQGYMAAFPLSPFVGYELSAVRLATEYQQPIEPRGTKCIL
jgi:hypothetical protein